MELQADFITEGAELGNGADGFPLPQGYGVARYESVKKTRTKDKNDRKQQFLFHGT